MSCSFLLLFSSRTRILSCFKLNAFEYLNLPFDSSPEDVKKQYRKLSLLVHPDKCKHPQAKEAFSALAKAQQLLLDPQEREYLVNQINAARGLYKSYFLFPLQ
ncbi:putative DnaJ domain, Chaperone J-domain superfamily [Helianthus annuus]|nr:putative DnaJ domain, Chaperone J-domain superfamily [Helianthus annuus]